MREEIARGLAAVLTVAASESFRRFYREIATALDQETAWTVSREVAAKVPD